MGKTDPLADQLCAMFVTFTMKSKAFQVWQEKQIVKQAKKKAKLLGKKCAQAQKKKEKKQLALEGQKNIQNQACQQQIEKTTQVKIEETTTQVKIEETITQVKIEETPEKFEEEDTVEIQEEFDYEGGYFEQRKQNEKIASLETQMQEIKQKISYFEERIKDTQENEQKYLNQTNFNNNNQQTKNSI